MGKINYLLLWLSGLAVFILFVFSILISDWGGVWGWFIIGSIIATSCVGEEFQYIKGSTVINTMLTKENASVGKWYFMGKFLQFFAIYYCIKLFVDLMFGSNSV